MFRWRQSILPLCLVLALLLTSCAGGGAAPAPAAPAAESGQAAAPAAPAASTEGLAEVPRNRTLIMAGLGGEHPGAFTDVDLFNSYVPGLSRSGYYQACNEGLFYYNMIGDEFIPWMAESFEYNEDFTEVVVTLREGVQWSDGEAFTAEDVAFTLDMLLTHPDLSYAGEIIDTVSAVEVIDDLNVRITLTTTNPRFIFDKLTFHADLGVPMAPSHVYEGVEDPSTMTPNRDGRFALAPMNWWRPMCNRRFGTCAKIGGPHRLASNRCPRFNG
jgi:peptide/nickel transport system substrate-binding protein